MRNDEIIKTLSIKLTNEFGKGFSKRNLDNMKKFYLAYSIVQNLSAQFKLSFSQVETKAFNQVGKRNIDRSPVDYMFQLSQDEFSALRSQFVTSSGNPVSSILEHTATDGKNYETKFYNLDAPEIKKRLKHK